MKPIQKWIVDMWRDDKIEKITEALAAEKLLTPQLEQQISAVNNYNEKEKVNKMLKERQERIAQSLKKFAQKIVKAKADGVLQESLTWIIIPSLQD